MMVDPNANIKKGSGKDLTVVQGEILDVIQQTNEKKVLCRNEQGKCTCCAPSCEKHCNTRIILWFSFIFLTYSKDNQHLTINIRYSNV